MAAFRPLNAAITPDKPGWLWMAQLIETKPAKTAAPKLTAVPNSPTTIISLPNAHHLPTGVIG
jgi:hypothetical protein